VSELCDEIDTLRRILEAPSPNAIHWRIEHDKIKHQIENLTRSESIFDIEEKKNLEKQLENQLHKNAKVVQELEETKLRFVAVEQKIGNLQKIVSSNKDDMKCFIEEIESLEKERGDMKQIHINLERKNMEYSKQTKSLLSENSSVLDELNALVEKESHAKRIIEEQHFEIKKLEDEIIRTNEVKQMQGEDELTKQNTYDKEKEEIREKESEKINDLEKKIKITAEENRKIKEKNKIIVKECDEAFIEFEHEVSMMKSERKQEVSKLNNRISELEEACQTMIQESARLEKERDDALSEISSIKGENSLNLQDKISSLMREGSDANQRASKWKAAAAEEKRHARELAGKLKKIIKDRDELEFELDAMQEDQDVASENIRILSQKNDALENSLQEEIKKRKHNQSTFYNDDKENERSKRNRLQGINEHASSSLFSPGCGLNHEMENVLHKINQNKSFSSPSPCGREPREDRSTPFRDLNSEMNVVLEKITSNKRNESLDEGNKSFDENMFLPNV